MPAELSATEALSLWHRVCLDQVCHQRQDFSLRQMAILLHIYLVPPPHTVRGLASALCVTKPVITRALDSLGAQKLVDRTRDPDDGRNVIIKRTVDGALFLEKLCDSIRSEARRISS